MSDIPKVIKLEFHVRSGVGIGGSWKNKPVWVADVEVGKTYVSFTRYPSETEWYCDFLLHDGLPGFSHGEGDRTVRKKIAVGALKVAIEEAKVKWIAEHGTEPIPVFGVA